MSRMWNRSDVDLQDYWRKGDRIYKVVGIADSPTVEIRDLLSGQIENHVISSLNFSEYERLRPEKP